ncbi:GntR family transcriptional regulator [Allorhizocola rhizosphaerae]|uniref:GntR family transcriptional regulator n=1 Tax=Allorhizocola rhizosphaerae TaxID=1872709 RepID=UPI000E3B842C|nr:GntR family transcriptional regulator [Allorhizocola rhizosphaerae]
MEKNWSTFRELLLPTAAGPRWLERALREAIRSGHLPAGIRLPSSRDLAVQLGLARGTVTAAYDQLIAEGYLTARRGSGTRVALASVTSSSAVAAPVPPVRWEYDLRTGMPALGAFPRAAWISACRIGLEGKRLYDRGGSVAEQAGFAELLRSGGYDRHLRKTRRLYRQRRDALLAELAARFPEWQPVGIAAGLHVVLRLPAGVNDRELAKRLAGKGIRLAPLSAYAMTTAPYPGLVIGYGNVGADRLRAAAAAIASALSPVPLGSLA